MAIFEKTLTVRIRDVGEKSLISNMGILSLLEEAACMHSDVAGYGMKDIEKTKLTWVVLQWKVKVLKRVEYASNVVIKTWARWCSKVTTLRDFEMYNEKGELLCVASSKWALIDTEKDGITKITQEIMKTYEPEEKSVFQESDIPKIKEPDNIPEANFEFKVLRKDIDVNKHMHNTNYLDYAYSTIPSKVYEKLDVNNIEILYKTGAKLDEKIKCFYQEIENAYYVVMKNKETNKLNAIVKLS